MRYTSFLLSSLAIAKCVFAGFPLPPKGTITKRVPSYPGASISYKETFICETNAKGYAGYVHIPSTELSDIEGNDQYNISMFFWYFEARNDPRNAQTSIYLAGGPGESSMYGAVQSGGPCSVLSDSNTTANNPWSWNANVNMLYVDQPVGTGFSYDALVKSTHELLNDTVTAFADYNGTVPAESTTLLYGTFPSQSPSRTVNTSQNAARIMWLFSQIWFSSFPGYQTADKRISLWGNSYGGYYVPTTARYMVEQNAKVNSGKTKGIILPVAQVGWTNGCTDAIVQGPYWPEQAYNNTYNLQVIPKKAYNQAKADLTKPKGCLAQVTQCRALGLKLDPKYDGTNAQVNGACATAFLYCFQHILGPYNIYSNRSAFDMAHLVPDPFPTSYLISFLNKPWVQHALGVPLNFTANSGPIQSNFVQSGDFVRVPGKETVEYLLARGVRVNLVYGDRDYRCPWNGAEALSLSFDWSGAAAFRTAGYQSLQPAAPTSYGAPNTPSAGVVRQHGNLTFTRVFQAGHDVASYAPQAMFSIFDRAMSGRDVASGTRMVDDGYSSAGPRSSFSIKNKLPTPPPPVNCNLYAIGSTCTVEQYEALEQGTAVIVNSTVVQPSGGSPGPLPGSGI